MNSGSSASRIVLDTSAYSHLRGRNEEVIRLMSKAEEIQVPTIVIGELEAAFRLGSRFEDNVARLTEFLSQPNVTVRPVSREVAHRYGVLTSALRRAGTPVATNDIWIAATALDSGASVLTFDRDFEKFDGLSAIVLTPSRRG